jgi:hypothetical protein
MHLYCGDIKGNKKLPQYGRTDAPVIVAV